MTLTRWIIRAALVFLFWGCVVVWFCVSSGCCDVQCYAEREADRQEGEQR